MLLICFLYSIYTFVGLTIIVHIIFFLHVETFLMVGGALPTFICASNKGFEAKDIEYEFDFPFPKLLIFYVLLYYILVIVVVIVCNEQNVLNRGVFLGACCRLPYFWPITAWVGQN